MIQWIAWVVTFISCWYFIFWLLHYDDMERYICMELFDLDGTMPEATDIPDNVPAKQLNNYARALRDRDPTAISQLSKGEVCFYLADILGGDLTDTDGNELEHPSDHNSNVSLANLRTWAQEVTKLQQEVSAYQDDEGDDENDDEGDDGGDE